MAFSRHAELVSASISRPQTGAPKARWTLKQVQGDEWEDSSCEYPSRALDPADQRVDIRLIAIEPEARPRGGGHAERVHQRLRAVVAGADGDVLFVEDGAEVVRM